MPFDGSGVYSKPAGTTAAPDTKIESAKFNAFCDDVVGAINGIVGGTRAFIGPITTPQHTTKKEIINANSASPTTDITDALLQIAAANGANARQLLEAWGAGAPIIVGRSSQGTKASPSATVSGDTLISIEGRGYGTSYTNRRASHAMRATETWSNTAQGAKHEWRVTANTTTNTVVAMTLDQDGSLSVPGGVSTTTGLFSTNVIINGVYLIAGTGSPEGIVFAPQGSMYMRTDNFAPTSLYRKGSGSGNTGWVAL